MQKKGKLLFQKGRRKEEVDGGGGQIGGYAVDGDADSCVSIFSAKSFSIFLPKTPFRCLRVDPFRWESGGGGVVVEGGVCVAVVVVDAVPVGVPGVRTLEAGLVDSAPESSDLARLRSGDVSSSSAATAPNP